MRFFCPQLAVHEILVLLEIRTMDTMINISIHYLISRAVKQSVNPTPEKEYYQLLIVSSYFLRVVVSVVAAVELLLAS